MHGAARQHDVVTLAVELDNLEFQGLAFERCRILNRTGVDQRTRQEGADAVDHNGQTALDLAIDGAGPRFRPTPWLFPAKPRCETLGLVARQDGVAKAVFQRSIATETKSPTLTSSSPLSFLNSSIGMKASDLRPALTITKLWSRRTTSAEITSPERMS